MLELVPQDPVTCKPADFDGMIDDLLALAAVSRKGVPVQAGPVALIIIPGESSQDVSARCRARLSSVNKEMEAYFERRQQGDRRQNQIDDFIPDRREGERRNSQQNTLRSA